MTSVAAMPEEKARPYSAPSRLATVFSRASIVGLPQRVYSNPPRSSLRPSCAKVVDA